MFEVAVEQTFAAGHALRNYKGKCENVHGHNYRVQLRILGDELDKTGLLIDFGDMKRILREIIAILDHQFINDIEPFTTLNPTAENMTKWFYDEVMRRLPADSNLTIGEVKVWETDIQYAAYRP